jgi:hypothetical protein
MYQSCCDVRFALIWRDATEHISKIAIKVENNTIPWKQMIVIWITFSVAYRKVRMRLRNGRKGEKSSLSENTRTGSQYCEKKTVGDTHQLKIVEGEMY